MSLGGGVCRRVPASWGRQQQQPVDDLTCSGPCPVDDELGRFADTGRHEPLSTEHELARVQGGAVTLTRDDDLVLGALGDCGDEGEEADGQVAPVDTDVVVPCRQHNLASLLFHVLIVHGGQDA